MGTSYVVSGKEALFLLSGKLIDPDPELISLVLTRLINQGFSLLIIDMEGLESIPEEGRAALETLRQQADILGLQVEYANAAVSVMQSLTASA